MFIQSHCPLCVQPLPDNKSAFIFLDIDHVLIDRQSNRTADRIENTIGKLFIKKSDCHNGGYTELEWRIAAAHHFYESPLENLNLLIKKIQKTRPVHIILSSQWRNDGTLDEIRTRMFAHHGFASLIVGKTPPKDREKWAPEIKKGYFFGPAAKEKYNLELRDRSEEIEFWLRDHKLEKVDFVILDDVDNGLSKKFPNQFVSVDSFLTRTEVDIALKILKISE